MREHGQHGRLVEPEVTGRPHGLGDETDLRGEQRIVDEFDVDEFDALPGAGRPDVQDGVGIAGRYRTGGPLHRVEIAPPRRR